MAMLGASFTRWRAEALGLDYRLAFARLCEMKFDLVRLSCSWREVQESGWMHLDWLMAHAAQVRQAVTLTVGMKALGWPEFYLPDGMDPQHPTVQEEARRHIAATVARYIGHPTLTCWQIENEPFNRSGPQARWLPRALVRREANTVRRHDRKRPVVLTCFGHFTRDVDRASRRPQAKWRDALGVALGAEREALSILRPGDTLGLDVYRAIGWTDETGLDRIAHADQDQVAYVRRWQRIARGQRKRFWITEAQAEPWEARSEHRENPRSVSPADLARLMDDLSGIEAVLLWGSEYWLWRADQGDSRWIDAVASCRRASPEATAPV